ncbi:MAG TPA: SUMF1/EgtB/PvdO family nonheme iron enzyme, partial [Myxococcota bacterium]|nr:SUMF1/EgtB/PvdO family nonheme iron enzyme [Myxococcota bacterium]
ELAWEMQGEAEKVDSPKEVPREQVLRLLARGRERAETLQREEPAELLRRLRLDCGVLYSAEDVYYQFIHLTFQEYLASEYAAAYNLGARLAERAAEPRWREPILLAMAQPGLSRAFFQQLLRQDLQIHRSILEACFREETPPAEPFVEFLLGEPGPPAADLVHLLSLFRTNAPALVREAAEKLLAHPDKGVAQLAAEVSGKPLPPRDDGVFVGLVDDPRGFVGTGTARKQVKLGVGSRWRSKELGMEFVWVPPGTFWMGATVQAGKEGFDVEARQNEGPPHPVQINRGFWMGRFPVTNAQVRPFVQESGSKSFGSLRRSGFDGADQPAVELSWHDAQDFCLWASRQTGMPVTLPTEAEWEYAARGSDGRKYPWGNEKPNLKRAWYGSYGWDEKAVRFKRELGEHQNVTATAAVGGRPDGAGPFGAEEQAGNVWEWCFDTYMGRYDLPDDKAAGGVVRDPGLETLLVGPSSHGDKSDKEGQIDDKRPFRVLRGGAWFDDSRWLRAAVRYG